MGFLVKILLLYIAFKLVWSFFSKGNRIKDSKRAKTDESINRYDAEGDVIEDADFEEVP